MTEQVVVWFRRDLRLTDNPAWSAADGATVTALWVLEPDVWAASGPHRRAVLAGHLAALDAELADRGGRLRIETGPARDAVPAVAADAGATRVCWNDDVSPWSVARDRAVAAALREGGVAADRRWGALVHPPGSVRTRAGTVPRVFTPFHRTWEATPLEAWPNGEPCRVADHAGRGWPSLSGRPTNPNATHLGDGTPPGEAGAARRLTAFLAHADRYLDERDHPGTDGTSDLGADLRFGTISPRHVVEVVGTSSPGRAGFVRQLAWRDWYAHLMWELPHLRHAAMKPELDRVAWRNDPDEIDAWRDGRTGYPLVDAGMRQLAATGRLHNRVRMVCASFLVKDLLVDWRIGERWFRRLLVDADVPQNVGNWQWCAGTGPDAAPYFRVFHPVTQSRRFDAAGTYVRRWVPELAGLDDRAVHAPWEAPPLELAAAGVVLGVDYPAPVVDHTTARERVLAAYAEATRSGT